MKDQCHLVGHVEFDKAYYSVPPEYLGREVWVRGESRIVRILNHRQEVIALHPARNPVSLDYGESSGRRQPEC